MEPPARISKPKCKSKFVRRARQSSPSSSVRSSSSGTAFDLRAFRQQDPVGFYRMVEQSLGPGMASMCHPGPEVLRAQEQVERERNEALAPSLSPYWDYFPSADDPIESLAKWQRVRIHGLEKKPAFNSKLGWSSRLLGTGRWSIRLLETSTVLSVRLSNLERSHTQACEAITLFRLTMDCDPLRCIDLCRNLSYKLATLQKSKAYITQMKAAGMKVLETWMAPTVDDEKLVERAAVFLMRMVDELGTSSTRQDYFRLALKLEFVDKAMQRIESSIFGGIYSRGEEASSFSSVVRQLTVHLQGLKEYLCLTGIIEGVLGAEAKFGSKAVLLENTARADRLAMAADVIQECFHPDPPASRDATDDIIAEVAWASGVEARIQNHKKRGASEMPLDLAPDGEIAAEEVYLLQFSRYPEELRAALLEGVALRQCRQAMENAGHNVSLPSGAKIFVHPMQYKDVAIAVSGMELRPYHVVVSQSLEHLIQESLQHIPRQSKIKIKARSLVQLGEPLEVNKMPTPVDVGWEDSLCEELDVKRTFLCVAPKLRNSGSVIQSTTEAHGGVNPRRFVQT